MARGFSYTLEGFKQGLRRVRNSNLRPIELKELGCVLYCPLREIKTGITKDLSGYGNDGIVIGASLKKTGDEYYIRWKKKLEKIGDQALSFDGIDDYVQIGNPASLQIAKNLTVEVWIYFNRYTHQAVNYFIAKHPGWGFFVGGNEPYTNDVGVFYNSTIVVYADGVFAAVGVRKWTHLAFTYDGNTTKIYLNGVSQPTTGTFTNDIILTNDLNIGRRTDIFGFVDGLIGEVRIYNRALSVEEIYYHYKIQKDLFR